MCGLHRRLQAAFTLHSVHAYGVRMSDEGGLRQVNIVHSAYLLNMCAVMRVLASEDLRD